MAAKYMLFVEDYPGYSSLSGLYAWHGSAAIPADVRASLFARFSYCSSCRADFSADIVCSEPKVGPARWGVTAVLGFCVCGAAPCRELAQLRAANARLSFDFIGARGELVTPETVNKVCNYCALRRQVAHLQQCTRCKTARYCSAECQKKHWRVHRNECKAPVSVNKDD